MSEIPTLSNPAPSEAAALDEVKIVPAPEPPNAILLEQALAVEKQKVKLLANCLREINSPLRTRSMRNIINLALLEVSKL